MAWHVEAQRGGGINLPQIGWRLDARERSDCSFVSHAHADHLGRHRTVICTEVTGRLMAARMPGRREVIALPFSERWPLSPDAQVQLFPAGHILGSAQWRVENDHGSLLYTGDFKLRPGLAAERCATPQADVLIMETTFGKPRYVFPPTEKVIADLVSFCHNAVADGMVPFLFCYSLGKTQEVLAGLREANLPIMLHPQAGRMTAIYEDAGMRFPAYRTFESHEAAGHVVIGPPQIDASPDVRRITRRRTAVITGWALDPWMVPRHRYDAAFPLSDHADYRELHAFVDAVRPKVVYTIHGFATEFARDLRARGIEAWALGRENQLDLALTL